MGSIDIIIGNLCSLCAMITDSISGTRKTRSQILGIQIISRLFYVVGTIVLKGYSATVQNSVAILRNIAAIKGIKSKTLEWVLIMLGVVLGIIFNNLGLFGWIPIIANFEYSFVMLKVKGNEKVLKISFIISFFMFSIFLFGIKNYIGGVSNLVVVITTTASLIKEIKEEKQK